uniref:Putative moody-like protein n=1 Tax=Cupiennius salei TaxID=6928 RepID=A0A061QFZ2_CUPSA
MTFSYDNWQSVDPVTTLPSILERRGLLYFSAFCVIVIIIVGLTGNALTIIALVRCPRVRSATAAFIISLSVADLIFCCINLPFSASRFINQKWVHGDTLCVLFPFLRYVNVGLSLLSITAIAINRYILIVHPSLYTKVYRKRYIAAMVIFIWCFATAMILPTLLGKWGRFGYDPAILNCSILEINGQSSKTFLFVFGFVVPCLAIAICYARIFWVVRKSRTRVQKHSASETSAQRKDREAKRKKEEWRVTRMVLIIFCSFLLCYLPITIVKVSDQHVQRPELHIVGYLLIYLSACINPVIYGITNKQYRQAYKTVLLCKRPRALSFSGGHPPQQHHDDSTGLRTTISLVTSVPSVSVGPDSVFMEEKSV